MLHHDIDRCALAFAGVAHVVDAEVDDAVRRKGQVLLQLAPELARRDAKASSSLTARACKDRRHPLAEVGERGIVDRAEEGTWIFIVFDLGGFRLDTRDAARGRQWRFDLRRHPSDDRLTDLKEVLDHRLADIGQFADVRAIKRTVTPFQLRAVGMSSVCNKLLALAQHLDLALRSKKRTLRRLALGRPIDDQDARTVGAKPGRTSPQQVDGDRLYLGDDGRIIYVEIERAQSVAKHARVLRLREHERIGHRAQRRITASGLRPFQALRSLTVRLHRNRAIAVGPDVLPVGHWFIPAPRGGVPATRRMN